MRTFTAARGRVPRLEVVRSIGSTNDGLLALARVEGLPPYSVMVTDDQTAGRGRQGRFWSTPAGKGLAISMLCPPLPRESASWIALAAGLAMRDAIAPLLGHRTVAVKWPNDVLVGGRKICGVLGQFSDEATVIGAGLNVRLSQDELPVEQATSLLLEGVVDIADDLDDGILERYLIRLRELLEGLRESDAEASGLRSAVRGACDTIGRDVRVVFAKEHQAVGRAVDIDSDGRLRVRTAAGIESISAGDVIHVRPSNSAEGGQ